VRKRLTQTFATQLTRVVRENGVLTAIETSWRTAGDYYFLAGSPSFTHGNHGVSRGYHARSSFFMALVGKALRYDSQACSIDGEIPAPQKSSRRYREPIAMRVWNRTICDTQLSSPLDVRVFGGSAVTRKDMVKAQELVVTD